jgi:hypothetical protein
MDCQFFDIFSGALPFSRLVTTGSANQPMMIQTLRSRSGLTEYSQTIMIWHTICCYSPLNGNGVKFIRQSKDYEQIKY